MTRLRMLAGAVAAGAAIYLLLGGWVGAVLAVGVMIATGRALRRLEDPADRHRRARIRSDVPFAADLLAATLRAGMPTEPAVRTVGIALGGPLGVDLVAVAGGLRLGLDPTDAWAAVAGTPAAERLAGAFVRAADSGAAVAGALDRVADAERAEAASRAEAAVQRLSVLMVLPLGLCFLPAFIFAGVAPVIVAELGGVLR